MWAAVITILAALIPFVIWLIKRNIAKNEDPHTAQEKWVKDTENEIAKDDAVAANARIGNSLFKYRMRKAESNLSRPRNTPAKSE